MSKTLYLNYHELTKLTESDLIQFCQLKNFKPNELETLNLNSNYLNNLDFIKKNTPFINLKYLNISDNNLRNIDNIKYLTQLSSLSINSLPDLNKTKLLNTLKILKNLTYLYCDSSLYPIINTNISNINVNYK